MPQIEYTLGSSNPIIWLEKWKYKEIFFFFSCLHSESKCKDKENGIVNQMSEIQYQGHWCKSINPWKYAWHLFLYGWRRIMHFTSGTSPLNLKSSKFYLIYKFCEVRKTLHVKVFWFLSTASI